MKRKRASRISAEHEAELVRIAQGPDPQAARKACAELVEAHTPFIVTVIKEFTFPSWVAEDDVMQQGRLGILDAIRRFQPEKGYRLLTYAYWRIKKEITTYLSEMGYPAKLPFPDVVKLKRLAAKDPAARSSEEREQLMLQKNVHILELIGGCLPIHPTEHGSAKENDTYASGIESQLITSDPADTVLGQIMLDELARKLSELTALEGAVLGCMYGLHCTRSPLLPREMVGETSRLCGEGDTWDVTPGIGGFGLEIGATYNGLGKVVKQAEAKLRQILRKSFVESLAADVET